LAFIVRIYITIHGPLNVKLYVYCVKGFSVQTQLQIPLHLYTRIAEDEVQM